MSVSDDDCVDLKLQHFETSRPADESGPDANGFLCDFSDACSPVTSVSQALSSNSHNVAKLDNFNPNKRPDAV